MNFNADPNKQTQEIIFSKKLQNTNQNQVYFNHNTAKQFPLKNILESILMLN